MQKASLENIVITKARKIQEKLNFEFLLELFLAELDEHDIKRRKFYPKSAKFDVVTTFEKYIYDDN
ncbi:hypothetical protein FACS1894105_09310 [Clostridia bacterium]|nr:hypothetical protein FACS1894105_09310 [Clostridia bacterium]